MGPTDLAAAVVTKGTLTSSSILTIEPDDDAQREIIRFNGVFGGSTFVTQNVSFRYLPGSAAPSGLTHPSGSIVRSTPTAQHLEDINDRVDALDHGADLAGLGDDDHTQYHNDARGDARYVELAGDTMTGLIVLSADPSVALNAATKQYVDTLDGPYTDYTPSFTGFNLNNGTIDWARYVEIRKQVTLLVRVTLGDTSSVVGNIEIDLPVTAASLPNVGVYGNVVLEETGTDGHAGAAAIVTTGRVGLGAYVVSGSSVVLRNTSATVPFTWGDTDIFSVEIVYEAA